RRRRPGRAPRTREPATQSGRAPADRDREHRDRRGSSEAACTRPAAAPRRHRRSRARPRTLRLPPRPHRTEPHARLPGHHMSAPPYMPNSTPELERELLEAVGAPDVESLFAQIPASHRLRGELELPPALVSEVALRRHLTDMLGRNENCEQNLSFLGGGIWQHHVPAICDEVVGRSEFLTPVWGTPSSDHGRNQAWFEFASQLAELIGMDFVGL